MKKIYFLLFSCVFFAYSSAQIFTANFDDVLGTGGNSGGWNGTIGNGSLATYTTGGTWTLSAAYKGDQCLKIGTSSLQGSVTTPELSSLNGTATLTFKAGAWDTTNEQTELLLEISGGGTLSMSSVTMTKGSFKNFSIVITGGTANTKVTFKGKQAASSRFFLDNIVVTAGLLNVKNTTKIQNFKVKNTKVEQYMYIESKGSGKLFIYTLDGRLMKTVSVSKTESSIDLSSLKKGQYLVSGEINSEKINQKILKQ